MSDHQVGEDGPQYFMEFMKRLQAHNPTHSTPPHRQNEIMIPERFTAPAPEQFLHLGKMHDLQIRAIITFQGRLDAGRLARAVRLTLDAEPVLGCVFHRHAWRPYWKRHQNPDAVSFFSMVETSDLTKDLHAFMAEPLDPCADLQVQVRLFRCEGDTMCIRINHMVADGTGIMDYIALLANVYRQLKEHPGYYPAPNLQGRRGQRQVLRHVGLGSLLRACRHFSVPRSNGGFPITSQDFSGRAFASRSVESDRFMRIKRYCREREASMNDVLLTAFYRSLFTVLDTPPGKPLPVTMTVDLRRHIPSGQGEAICNLAGVFFPVLERREGDAFDDTLAQVHRLTRMAKKHHPWLAEALHLELAFLFRYGILNRLMRFAERHHMIADNLHPFTNLGMIHPERIDFGETEVTDFHTFGPVFFSPCIVLGTSTFRKILTVALSYCNTAIDEEIIHRFLDWFVSELPA